MEEAQEQKIEKTEDIKDQVEAKDNLIIAEKRPEGRPTLYCLELASEICGRLARGRSLRKVCEDEDMPDLSTVFDWLRKYTEFAEQYAEAKEQSAESDAEVLDELGDEAIREAKSVGEKRANAVVSAYKLKADNIKWAMSKKKPKKYGDKLDMTTNGKDIPAPIYGGKSVSQ